MGNVVCLGNYLDEMRFDNDDTHTWYNKVLLFTLRFPHSMLFNMTLAPV